jgi:hypothetical protein
VGGVAPSSCCRARGWRLTCLACRSEVI